MLTIRLVTDYDIIIRCWYLGDAVLEIIILLFRDTSPIRDGVAQDYFIIIWGHVADTGWGRPRVLLYYYNIVVTRHRLRGKWQGPLDLILVMWSFITNHIINGQ